MPGRVSVLGLTTILSLCLLPLPVGAVDSLRGGLGSAWDNSDIGGPGPGDSRTVPILAGQIVGYALSFVGIVFFILAVYGGFVWMTAKGNSERVEKGKDTVIAATLGIVIILGSYALTQFVLTSLQAPPAPSAASGA